MKVTGRKGPSLIYYALYCTIYASFSIPSIIDLLMIAVIERTKSGPFAFLIPLYGSQSNGVMLSLVLCLVTTIVLIATTALTHGILVQVF